MAKNRKNTGNKQASNIDKKGIRTVENKKRRLTRHLKKYPNDAIAKEALSRLDGKNEIPRRKPTIRGINKVFRSPYPNSTLKLKFNFRPRSPIPPKSTLEDTDARES